ncbi:MAG: GAF domain-containing protein [Deltaproteobacteria bacterium]|nr:GAF domain-containing protein [Deltaproteobacteria bacterium]
MSSPQRTQKQSWTVLCIALLVAGLALTAGVTSTRWVNTVFPGFFVLANNVVASVSLPHWPISTQQTLYQHVITTVDGVPVENSRTIYATVSRLPAQTLHTYATEKDGTISSVMLPSQRFTVQDYILLFGAYLFTGLAISAIGLIVWFLKPRAAASTALLSLSTVLGLFFLTAMDLYGPHWFFRVHILCEAFIGAGFLHLALVFPTDRLRRLRAVALAAPYGVSALLGFVYENVLYQPALYSTVHSLCETYAGLSTLPFMGRMLWEYCVTVSPLVRQRVLVIFLGFLGAFAIPTILTIASGLTGGELAVNYAVFTIFLFPLSLGYAIVKHDLFEIDALIKRGAYYLTLTATLTLGYALFVTLLNVFLQSSQSSHASTSSLFFTVAVVLLLNPLKEHVQKIVDRLFFRLRYDPKKVLEAISRSLASTLRREEIFLLIWNTLSETMGVQQGSIFLRDPGSLRYRAIYSMRDPERRHLTDDHAFLHRLQQQDGRAFSVYDFEDLSDPNETDAMIRQGFLRLGAQLVVPLLLKGELLGFFALGKKESGRFFSSEDRDFLHTLANQSALSIGNALAYEEIHELNFSLERKVEERTLALAETNSELQDSFAQLEQTYRELQRSQESLVRSEKMAALGRLTAGIAHEMNTPLGASMNALSLLQSLVDEYQQSIDDPAVTGHDHQEIATEMVQLVQSTRQWVEKASSHIRSLKAHTRDLQRNQQVEFSILQTVEETRSLLANRLRLSQSTLSVTCTETTPSLYGDPGKFGQVLTNLVANAIDSYKAAGKNGGEIHIEVTALDDILEIAVSDRGCGIAPEHLERIFDELFSTKPVGEGTGLGLSISRDIIASFFEGTISVTSTLGQGTTFTLRLPRHRGTSTHAEQPVAASATDTASQGETARMVSTAA